MIVQNSAVIDDRRKERSEKKTKLLRLWDKDYYSYAPVFNRVIFYIV